MNKKLSLLLVPIFSLLLTGCPANNNNDKKEETLEEKMLREAKELKYDENYGNDLVNPLGEDLAYDIATSTYNELTSNLVNVKIATFHHNYFVDNPSDFTQTDSAYNEVSIYKDFHFENTFHSLRINKRLNDNSVNEEPYQNDNVFFYHSDSKLYIDYKIYNGNESIDKYNAKDMDTPAFTEYYNNELSNYCYSYLSEVIYGCKFNAYQVNGNYVLMAKSVDSHEDKEDYGVGTITSSCLIYLEVNSKYQITKMSYFEEDVTTLDYQNKTVSDTPIPILVDHRVYSFEYGDRQVNKDSINMLEEKYGKPYFVSAFFSVQACSINYQEDYLSKVDLHSAHIDEYISFSSFSIEPVKFYGVFNLGYALSLYNYDDEYFYDVDVVDIKDPGMIRFENDFWLFDMGEITNALHFSGDFILENNKVKRASAYVEVIKKSEIPEIEY